MGVEDPPREDYPEVEHKPPILEIIGDTDEDELEASVRHHPSAGAHTEYTLITEKDAADDEQGSK